MNLNLSAEDLARVREVGETLQAVGERLSGSGAEELVGELLVTYPEWDELDQATKDLNAATEERTAMVRPVAEVIGLSLAVLIRQLLKGK